MKYFVLGVNHHKAPIEVRGKLAVSKSDIPLFLSHFKIQSGVEELAILSTCNRVEVYGTADAPVDYENKVRLAFAEGFRISVEELNPYLYYLVDLAAIEHGFRVAASLDSMIVGEPQILGQFKHAYQEAAQCQMAKGHLHKFFHRSFHAAKRVRTDTELAKNPVSFGFAAATLAKQIFGDLNAVGLLMIGAGKMAELTLRHLAQAGIQKIFVTNRTHAKAVDLAQCFNGEAIPYENFDRWLPDVEIVLTCTEANQFLLTKTQVSKAMRVRAGKSLFVVDVAVPRNVEPEVNELENVYLYNIDDLGHIIVENRKKREQEAKLAEEIVRQEAFKFRRETLQLNAAPLLSSLTQKMENFRQQELSKFVSSKHLDEAAFRETLEKVTHGLVHKMLHDPMMVIKEHSDDEEVLAMVKELFRLEEGDL
ncbi:MAG: glutamyl-tRNA reductase [Deltaproteobacteria bacterium]|nr:glutamyl-tRNA reductase [Deltaproteobacteria bacterium]